MSPAASTDDRSLPERLSCADPFARDVIALFGLPFDLDDLELVTTKIVRAAAARERLFLSTVNLDWLVMAAGDDAFRASAWASDLVTLDGVPVVRLAAMAGAAEASKVAGSDLFERLRDEHLSAFFFGGREGAGEAASAVLSGDGRAMRPAGHHNPGYGDVAAMSAPEHLGPVNGSGADVLVASLGAAKGQAWLVANAHRLAPPVIAHLGAVVDFTAGTVARAPGPLQRSGLEWAWRIGQDRALWRRYARDLRALPRLVARAREVRRLTGKLAGRAGPSTVSLDGGAVTLDGAPDHEALRDALRTALAARAPLRVTLREGAAPSLRVLGLLLLGHAAFARAGLGYELCTEGTDASRLLRLTVGSPPAGL